MDFYNLLYRGYTGEYQLVSSLYRNGLDAWCGRLRTWEWTSSRST